jgi:hypothetical protein
LIPLLSLIRKNLPVKNLGSDITVLLGLVPGLADDTAIVRAQDSFISFIGRDGGDGGGDSGQGGSGLKIQMDQSCFDLTF